MDLGLVLANASGSSLHEMVDHWLGLYQYYALFGFLMLGIAGIPLPDEFLLATVGVVAFGHKYGMEFWPTLLVAWAGASCGITFSYVLGRTAGLGAVHKWGKYFHITPEKLQKTHDWYAHKKGRWALMFCIFAPVWRHLTAIVAGTSKMPFWEFALCAYTGTLMWVSTFITLGFFFGKEWQRMSKRLHVALLICSVLAGIGMLAYIVWKNRRDSQKAISTARAASQCGPLGPGEANAEKES